jgi:peptidoglycan/xylan/chitin deacetylase (PgdA/CDA1 family)
MHARRPFITPTALMLASLCTGAAALVVVAERVAAAPGTTGPVAVAHSPVPTPSLSPSPTAAPPGLVVNGSLVPAADNSTVATALAAAGITPRPGHYVSVVRQRRLGPDGRPARIYLDRRPASLTSPVAPGDHIVVRPGVDLAEPTETAVAHVAPAAPSALYVGSRSGLVRLVRGRFSHEIVSQRTVRRAKVGHLVRPGAVALTFDDGPARGWTRRVLALLKRHHVRATFCLIGSQAAAHPQLVRAIARAGHALCDHTWDHDLALRSRPEAQIGLDIHRGAHAIVRATHGTHPTFFRAPGGNWSTRMERLARRQGLTPLKWTVDPRDWARPGVRSIVRTVYAELRPGGVILMHDGGGNRAQSIAALRVLLRRLPRMGYHFVLPPDRRPHR